MWLHKLLQFDMAVIKNTEKKEFITAMSNEHRLIQYDFEMNRLSAGSRFIFILHMTTVTRSLGALNFFQLFFFLASCFDHHLTYWGTFPFKIIFFKKETVISRCNFKQSCCSLHAFRKQNSTWAACRARWNREQHHRTRWCVGGLCVLKLNPIPLWNSPNLLFCPD